MIPDVGIRLPPEVCPVQARAVVRRWTLRRALNRSVDLIIQDDALIVVPHADDSEQPFPVLWAPHRRAAEEVRPERQGLRTPACAGRETAEPIRHRGRAEQRLGRGLMFRSAGFASPEVRRPLAVDADGPGPPSWTGMVVLLPARFAPILNTIGRACMLGEVAEVLPHPALHAPLGARRELCIGVAGMAEVAETGVPFGRDPKATDRLAPATADADARHHAGHCGSASGLRGSVRGE